MGTQIIVTTPVLLDNTVLSNFALVRHTELPQQLWGGAICTTPEVVAEYQQGVAAGVVPAAAWDALPQLALTAAEQHFAATLSVRLGPGERTCLAAAHLRHGLLVTDDRNARTLARRLDVAVTGTIGILIRLVRDGHLTHSAAEALLAGMIAAGFRSPVQHLGEVTHNSETRRQTK